MTSSVIPAKAGTQSILSDAAIEIELTPPPTGPVPVCHVVKGEVVFGRALEP